MEEKDLIFAGKNNPLSHKEKLAKIKKAAKHYSKFMTSLGIDLENDPNSKGTPERVAKAFVLELWNGMYSEVPKITDFENLTHYNGIVFQGDVEVKSMCSHHHLAFIGKAHVAYLPDDNGKIIGLSKLNRVVEFFSRRPQVQENLTTQIHDYLNEIIGENKGVAVMIACNHTCASCRGVGHDSTMITSKLSGAFMADEKVRNEFYKFVDYIKK